MAPPSRRLIIDPSSPNPYDSSLFPLDPFPPLDSFPLPSSSPTSSYSPQRESPERVPSPLLPDSPSASPPLTANTQFPSFMRRTYNPSTASMSSMAVPTLNHGSSRDSSRTVSPARDRIYSSFPQPQEREIGSVLEDDVHPAAAQDTAERIGTTTDSTEFTDRGSTCSGCSQCSGERVIAGTFAFSSALSDEPPAIPATRNFNSLQQVSVPLRGESEQQTGRALPPVAPAICAHEPAATWSRSRPLGRLPLFDRVEAAKKINLSESETFEQEHPTSRHYEGCILCTPQPSPRTSLASSEEDDLQLFLAPSKQSAGPPPTEPLPALADPGTCPVPGKPLSPVIIISPPESDGKEKYGLSPCESNKEELLGKPNGSDDGLESFPVLIQEDEYFVPTIGVATKVYLKPDPYPRGIGHLPSNSAADFVEEPTVRRHSEPVGKRESISSQYLPPEICEGEAITPGHASSGDAKAPRTRTRSFPVISPAKDFASGVNRKRSSWTGVFGDPGSSNGIDPVGVESRSSSSKQPHGPRPALSFGRTPSPHPGEGIRDSYTGVDGAFEMVDLGSSTSTVATDLPAGKAHKFSLTRTMGNTGRLMNFRLPNFFQMSPRQKWIAVGVILFGGLVLVIFILIFVGGPLILKRALNSAVVEVQSFEIRDFTPDSLSVDLKLKLNSDEKSNIPLGATMYNLVANNSLAPSGVPSQPRGNLRSLPPVSDYAPRRSAIQPKRVRNVPNTIFESGFLGNFSTKATSLRDGVGTWTVSSKVTLGSGGDLRLRDPRAWSGFMLSLINREAIEVGVYGKVPASFMGARRKVDISKEVTIKCLGGFGGIKIKDHGSFYGPNTRFLGELIWYNPSQLTLSLPNINFFVSIGSQEIGYARLEAQTIMPGDNILRSFHGGLDTDILRANRTLLGIYLSGFIPQETTEAQNMLWLQGNSTDLNGIEIPWLLPAIKAIGFALPLVSQEFPTLAHALPLGDAPNWQFIFATNDMNGLGLMYANISIALGLPFEKAGLLSLINDIRWDMRIAHNQDDLLRVTTGFGTSNNSFRSIDTGRHLITSLLGRQATIDIVDREAWDKIVSRDLITDSMVPLIVNSTVDLDVRTPLGDATVSGLAMINQTLWVKGLGGMDNGGKDRAVVSQLRVSGGNKWAVDLAVYNPSDVNVDLGATPFDVFVEENGSCFATINVTDFDLRRGWSNFTSALTINPPNCKPQDVGEFFGKVISGGVTNLTLRYSEFNRERFAGRPFITGLTALKKGFGAMLVSEGYRLIEAIDILFSGKSTRAVVTMRSVLPGSVSFNLVDMILYTPGGGGFEAAFNSTFENVVPTMIGRLPQVDITSKATKTEMAANLARLVGKDTKMNVQGRLGINWNGVESIINYAQGDIVVRVGNLWR